MCNIVIIVRKNVFIVIKKNSQTIILPQIWKLHVAIIKTTVISYETFSCLGDFSARMCSHHKITNLLCQGKAKGSIEIYKATDNLKVCVVAQQVRA